MLLTARNKRMPFFLYRENSGWEQLSEDASVQIESVNSMAIRENTGPMTGYGGPVVYAGIPLTYIARAHWNNSPGQEGKIHHATLQLLNGDEGEVREADVVPETPGWFHKANHSLFDYAMMSATDHFSEMSFDELRRIPRETISVEDTLVAAINHLGSMDIDETTSDTLVAAINHLGNILSRGYTSNIDDDDDLYN